MRVLVVDNYDSFVFNLVQYLGQLGVEATVRRNDDPSLTAPRPGGTAAVDNLVTEFDGVLISPGPGTPDRAGVSIELVHAAARHGTPLLGVCLGHQAIGAAFGGIVTRAPELLHGKTSSVFHTGTGVLAGLPDPFTATRYHSLTVLAETLPAAIEVIGHTESGIVMAMRHRTLPIHGVQFHPESVLTQGGHRMLANWLEVCGERPAEGLIERLEAEVAALV
jgi:para-aminobenzoate synthetase component 2